MAFRGGGRGGGGYQGRGGYQGNYNQGRGGGYQGNYNQGNRFQALQYDDGDGGGGGYYNRGGGGGGGGGGGRRGGGGRGQQWSQGYNAQQRYPPPQQQQQQQQQPQQQQRYPQQQGQQRQAPKDTRPPDVIVLDCLGNERPRWILSCFAHNPESGTRDNDLKGDASFEEVRWQQYQEKASGVPDFQLQSNFRAALVAKERELKALVLAGRRLPSLGGAPIHEHNPWLAQITGSGAPTGIFGTGRPGQQAPLAAPFATQPAHPFGGAPGMVGTRPPAFGPGAQPAAPFGPGAAPFAPPPAAFGQQTAFGQQHQQHQQPTTFGQPQLPATPPAHSPLFGQPFPAATQPQLPPQSAPAQPPRLFGQPAAFGQPAPPGAAPPPAPFGGAPGVFGAGQPQPLPPALPVALAAGAPLAQASTSANGGGGLERYMAPYTRGQIPDSPPPQQLCT